jgi:hypothetical protein
MFRTLCLSALAAAAVAAGCHPSVSVGEIPQDRRRLPERVVRILVAPFGGDPDWSRPASEMLVEGLRERLKPPRRGRFGAPPENAAGTELLIIGPGDLPEPPLPGRERRRFTEQAAFDLARTVRADAVIYGNVEVIPFRPEGLPRDEAPVSVSVLWEATMVDTATREVYAHALRSESRRPDAAESSGRPESLQLDRRPRRERPRELSEVSAGLLLELTNRFISEFADPGKPARARVADTPNIYGREAARFLADGKVDQAIDTYRRALRLHPGDPRTLYNLGVLYEHRNDPVSASRYYEAALAADPDDEQIKDARARVFDRVRAGPRPLTDR